MNRAKKANQNGAVMESIMELTSTAFQGDAVERLSSQIQETRSATRRGLDHAVPTSIAGISAYASDEGHAESLLQAFRAGNYPHVEASEVSRVIGDPNATTALSRSSEGFLSGIFGSRLSAIVDAIAGQSGVSRASASTLLGLATPLVLQAVGREATTRNLDARGLSRFLADQGRRAESTLPAPLSTALGGASLGQADSERRIGTDPSRPRDRVRGIDDRRTPLHIGRESGAPPGRDEGRPGRAGRPREGVPAGVLWLLASLALIALLAYSMLRQRRAEQPLEQRPDVTTPAPGTESP